MRRQRTSHAPGGADSRSRVLGDSNGSSTSIRFPRQRPLTIDKLNSPLNDGNGILTCRWHVAEPTAAMAEKQQPIMRK
jgi:hypothetical protein